MVAQDSDVTVPGVEKWALLVGVLPNLQQRGFKLQYPKSEQTKQTRQTRQSKRAVAEEDEEYTEGSSKSTSKRKLRTRANAGKSGKSSAPSPQDRDSLPILTNIIKITQVPNKQKAPQSAPPTAQIANPTSLKPASAPPARKAHATKSGIESSFPLQGQMSLSDGK